MKKIIYRLNKKFRTYEVRLDVQIRFEFLDKNGSHCEKIAPTMRSIKMLDDCRIFVFSNTLKKASGCRCSRHNLHRTAHNALLINN